MMRNFVKATLLMLLTTDYVLAQEFIVNPEVITPITLSSSDVNRVTCTNGEISDVVFSEEKGVTVKKVGNSAFIKFLIKMSKGVESYVEQETEFHIVCDGNVYTLIGKPRKGDPVTVRLNHDSRIRIEDNIVMYKGLSREEAIVKATLSVIKQEGLDNARQIATEPTKISFNELDVTKSQSYVIEGTGMTVHEFRVIPKQDLPNVNENTFIDMRFGKNIYGITLVPQPLRAGQPSRLIIIDGSVTHE